MASLLSPEQEELYVWKATIWAPDTLGETPSGGKDDVRHNRTPIATLVPCYKEAKPNHNSPDVLGRGDTDNIFTVDVFHFPVMWDSEQPALNLGSDYLIQFVAPGHLEDGRYFLTQGDKQVANLMANKQALYVRTVKRPRWRA